MQPLNFDQSPYRPFDKGQYLVAPLLRPLNLKNSNLDAAVFQIDKARSAYLASKRAALADGVERHIGVHELNPQSLLEVCRFISDRLVLEHPTLFKSISSLNPQTLTLECRDPSETIVINDQQDPFEIWTALSLLVQEDLAIWRMTPDREWLAAISILSPNHWAPEEKLGRSFAEVHAPVAGIESINAKARQMVDTMVNKGPFVRFAWGLATDTRLNHHPVPPVKNSEASHWCGRKFDPANPQLFVRTERQSLIPFPESGTSLFTIRTYFEDCETIKQDASARAALISALESMTRESRIYKGLGESYDDVLAWLRK